MRWIRDEGDITDAKVNEVEHLLLDIGGRIIRPSFTGPAITVSIIATKTMLLSTTVLDNHQFVCQLEIEIVTENDSPSFCSTGVSTIDMTGIETLQELRKSLEVNGIRVRV